MSVMTNVIKQLPGEEEDEEEEEEEEKEVR